MTISSLVSSRVWSYIRIKENSSIILKLENVNANPELGFYREEKGTMTKIEWWLPVILAQEPKFRNETQLLEK